MTEGFYVAIELGQGPGISCRDREFVCRDRVSWSGVTTEYTLHRDKEFQDMMSSMS